MQAVEKGVTYYKEDLVVNTAAAAKLFESVTKQSKFHKANPGLACAVRLFYNECDIFKQRFRCKGFTPIQCLKEHLLERGLMTVVQAVKLMQKMHRLGYF